MRKLFIRPMTLKELAGWYNVSEPTMRKWLKPFRDEIGILVGYFFTVLQIEIIIKRLGSPQIIAD